MQPHLRQLLVIAALVCTFLPLAAFAQPMDFSEVSLLVRAGEPEPSITREVSQRKLAQKLSSDQETKLKAQGASDSLIQTLRNTTVVSAPAQTAPAAAVADRGRRSTRDGDSGAADDHKYSRHRTQNNAEIIDVAVGEPVNLSAWGGADREFVFSRRSITDFRRMSSVYETVNFPFYRSQEAELTTDEVLMVEPVGSFTLYATYNGVEANGWEPMPANYTSITTHNYVRPIRVGRQNPVHIAGVPYNLYPIYAAGGVALYYIGRSSEDVVRLAVVSHWR
jgi:hypothetical protein